MSTVRTGLEVEAYQVQILGEQKISGRRLVVDGKDISKITTEVVLRVPANGPTELTVGLAPWPAIADIEVELEHLRFYLAGIRELLAAADDVLPLLNDVGRERLGQAARRVREPWL